MNVLIVSVDFLPQIGGISMMTHHVSNAFADLGNHVRVLAPNGATLPADYCARYELIEDSESSTQVREAPAYAIEIERIMALLNGINRERAIDHVLLMHLFYYGWPIMEFCRQQKTHYSVFVHGFEFRSQLIKPPKWRERMRLNARAYEDLRHSTLQVVRRANVRFVNSSVTAQLLDESNCGPHHIVGCGVPRSQLRRLLVPPHTSKDTDYRRHTFGRKGARTVLGFLGRVVPSKNVEFLVDLLPHLDPTIHLAIAGRGELERVAKHATCRGVLERVHLLGPVSEAEKWEFLTALDLLCLPSRMMSGGQMEGFGIVLIEATIRGTPVAVSHEGGMRDFVLDHNGIYLDTGNIAESAGAIASFLDDATAAGRCVRNAQQLVEEQLTYEKICERMLREMCR